MPIAYRIMHRIPHSCVFYIFKEVWIHLTAISLDFLQALDIIKVFNYF